MATSIVKCDINSCSNVAIDVCSCCDNPICLSHTTKGGAYGLYRYCPDCIVGMQISAIPICVNGSPDDCSCTRKCNIAEAVLIGVSIALLATGAVLFSLRPPTPAFPDLSYGTTCFRVAALSSPPACNSSMQMQTCCDQYPDSICLWCPASDYYYCTEWYGLTDDQCYQMIQDYRNVITNFSLLNTVGLPFLIFGGIICFISSCLLCCSSWHKSQWKKRKDITDQYVQQMKRSNNKSHIALHDTAYSAY